MKPTLLIDKVGGLMMMSSDIWDSKFKSPLSEEQLQLFSKWTKTTPVMDKLMPSSLWQSSHLTPPLTSPLVTSTGRLIQRCQDLISPSTSRFWAITMIETSLPGEPWPNSPSMLITKELKSMPSLTPSNGSKISRTLIQLTMSMVSVMMNPTIKESNKFLKQININSDRLEL